MFRSSKQYGPKILAALVLILGLLMPIKPQAQSPGNPHVIPPNAKPYRLTYNQWAANWWHWGLQLPVAGHPFNGCPNPPDGGQTGPVWFLATSNCNALSVPSGKSLFFPLVNTECSSLEVGSFEMMGFHGDTAAEQSRCAQLWVNGVVPSTLFCIIDGVPLKNLARYRSPSPQITFGAPTPWIFGDTGGTGSSSGDGYYLMLPPLSVGLHTLHFGGAFHFSTMEGDPFDSDFGYDATINLSVTP